jgi:putative membrane protein
MWHTDSVFSSGGHGFGMIIWLLIIVVVIVLIGKTILGKRNSASIALETLNKRYANGKISEEEYLKMKAELEK